MENVKSLKSKLIANYMSLLILKRNWGSLVENKLVEWGRMNNYPCVFKNPKVAKYLKDNRLKKESTITYLA